MRAVPRRDRHGEDRLVHVRRGRAPDAPVQRLRHRGGGVDLAVGLEARRQATASGCCRSPPPSPHGLRDARLPLEGLEEQAAAARPRRRPEQVAADGADAHRRHRRAGQGELPLRAAVGVRLPLPHHPDRHPSPLAHRLRRAASTQLNETGRGGDRHARDGHRADRTARRRVRRLRLLPVPRCRPRRLEATLRRYELFAEQVMPHFNGQLAPVQASYDWVMGEGDTFVTATINAQMKSIGEYQAEREATRHHLTLTSRRTVSSRPRRARARPARRSRQCLRSPTVGGTKPSAIPHCSTGEKLPLVTTPATSPPTRIACSARGGAFLRRACPRSRRDTPRSFSAARAHDPEMTACPTPRPIPGRPAVE